MASERQKEEQNLKEAFAGGARDRGRSGPAWTALTTLRHRRNDQFECNPGRDSRHGERCQSHIH